MGTFHSLPGVLRRSAREPSRAFAVGLALLRGHWYRVYYRMRGIRFRAGPNLRVFGRLSIRGPGRVHLGGNVVIHGRVTPWTYSADAIISIGDNTQLDGVRFGCAERIEIGRYCMFAECRILDTDFHSARADRHSPDAPVRTAAVVLADNVWVAAESGLLPGTRIGANSVVSFGSVCMREYPADVVIMGNPARVASPLPSKSGVGGEGQCVLPERHIHVAG